MHLRPPTAHKHIKKTPTCRTILTENKLAEKLFYNQGCKERPPQPGKKGREAIWWRPAPLVGGTEEEGGNHRLRDPPWGFWGSCHILGIAVLGTNTWKDESQQLV